MPLHKQVGETAQDAELEVSPVLRPGIEPPNPANSCYLIRIVEMAEDGKTLREIAEWLDERAAKDENAKPKYGGQWAPRSIGDILRNESLHGVYRENGKILLRHEGIISKERWDKLQAKLNANPKRRGPTRNDPMMLTDVIHCLKCGGIMHARRTDGWRRKDGTQTVYLYYRCDGTPRNKSTCRNTIPMSEVDSAVDEAFTTDPIAGLEIIEKIYIPAKGHADEIQEVDEEIDALDRNAPDYRSEWNRLMDLRDSLMALGTEPAHTEPRNTEIKMRDYWPTLDGAGKRDLLRRGGVKVLAQKSDEADMPPFVIIDGLTEGQGFEIIPILTSEGLGAGILPE